MSSWHIADCKGLNWDYSLWHRCNWFAGNLRTTSTTKFKLVSRYMNWSNSDVCARLPRLKQPPRVTPLRWHASEASGLLPRLRSTSDRSAPPHSSSVSVNDVHGISGKPARCCWGWLKRHQSLSLWLWIHHMSAYMRVVVNNSPRLNIPLQPKMENASSPTI